MNKYDKNICFEFRNLTISENTCMSAYFHVINIEIWLTFSDIFPNLVLSNRLFEKSVIETHT